MISQDRNPPRLRRLLVVGGTDLYVRSLESLLGSAFRVSGVRADDLLDSGASEDVDGILLEGLQDEQALELCRLLRGQRLDPTVPIVLSATRPMERDGEIAAYSAGAWDVWMPPKDPQVMIHKLDAFTRGRLELARWSELALLDRATGLYNARGLTRRGEEVAAGARRRRDALSCVVIAVGGDAQPMLSPQPKADALAERVAETCRRIARGTDAIGHLEGAEFGIIAPATAASGAVRLAERYRDAIDGAPPSGGARTPATVTRAGYCAVDDFSRSSVTVAEMLSRAMSAARALRSRGATGPFVAASDPVPLT